MKIINGQKWKEALLSAANAMANNAERINALNVFPVPDGDTGSNMNATIEYAANEIKLLNSEDIHEVANKFSRGMLLGARGNSGVILSQIFKGFTIAFEGKKSVNAFEIASAFDVARDYAYKSVMKPVEGTILTVIRQTAEDLLKTVTPNYTIDEVFKQSVAFARKSCDHTPELLAVLKEVGVTDSGGEGLVLILDGIYQALIGKPIKIESGPNQGRETSIVIANEVWDGEFGYCTEFIVDLKLPAIFDKVKFEKALERMGNSIVVVADENILKVHIHTVKPGAVFTFAQKFGEFIKIKSENMTLQANESHGMKKAAKEDDSATKSHTVSKEKIKIGVISCNTGQGIIEEMRELGTSFVIEAGQTMNPSAKDILTAIDTLNTDKIFILPNNSNIILVAQQVAQTSTKKIVVVPTKTQIQGISVMQIFDADASMEENEASMNKTIGQVLTGSITTASRTTKIDGVQVKANEFLAIAENKIIGSNKSKVNSACSIVDNLLTKEIDLVTIYYGQDATEADAVDLASYIESNYDVDIEIKDGGQPIYHFFIGFHKEFVWKE